MIHPESFVAEMLPEFDIVTRSNADHSELRILRQMSGRVCGKLWKCGARLVQWLIECLIDMGILRIFCRGQCFDYHRGFPGFALLHLL